MKTRNIGHMVAFTFITLGLYQAFWLYNTRREINTALKDPKSIPSFWLLASPFLLISIYLAFVLWTSHAPLPKHDPLHAVQVVFLISLFGGMVGSLVVPIWWFYRYFNAVHRLTRYTDSMLLYAFWIIFTLTIPFPGWMLLTQNDLNKYLTYGPGTPPATPPAPTQPTA